MKTNNFYKLLFISICCCVLIAGCRKEPSPEIIDPDEEHDLVSTAKKLNDTIVFLSVLERYAIGEHSCTISVPDDSYNYESDTSKVPVELLDTMSTRGLLETILKSPFFPDGGPSFYDVINNSLYAGEPNLIDEFYSRDDAASVIINRYLEMFYSCLDNNYSCEFRDSSGLWPYRHVNVAFDKIHMFMAQYPIIEKATDEEIDSLSKHIIKTIVIGTSVDLRFLSECFPSALWLAARIMYKENYQPFINIMPIGPNPSYPLAIMDGYHENTWSYPDNQIKYLLVFNKFIESSQE